MGAALSSERRDVISSSLSSKSNTRIFSAMRHVVFLFPCMLRLPLEIQVRFNLIDGGLYAVTGDQIDQPIRLEVGHANGANFSFAAQIFQLPPRGIVSGKGPMQQHQIQIIRAQQPRRIFHSI